METIKVLFCYDKTAMVLEGSKEEYLSNGTMIDTGKIISKKSFPKFHSKGYLAYVKAMKDKHDLYAINEITSELVVVHNQIIAI